jgi:alkylation response protein AidB-like acyl-CoA dehydrogenase
MNFDYTDQQNALRDSLQKWAAGEYDFEKRKAALAKPDAWKKNWSSFAELGLLAAPLPEEFGGLGGSPLDVAVVMEEFGKALVVEPYMPTVVIAGQALAQAGSQAQKEEHLNAIAAGERIIAFAQAEPKSRWALKDISTTAKKDGAGYTLTGQKSVVLGGPQADYLLVSARSSGAQRDSKGVCLFLIPKNMKGLSTRDYPTMDDALASEIYLENVAVGAEHLVGPADEALPLMAGMMDHANAALGHEAVGCMRMMHALTLEYAKTRKQFGKPIADFQVLQHRMVDMFVATEESVSMALLATLKLDADGAERARVSSSAKAFIGKASREVGQSAIQTHGGMGVTDEMRVGHYFKRATMIDATFGNADFHLKRYAMMSKSAA